MAAQKTKARLHEEVIVRLAELIRQGKLKPGDRLPPERELAERLQVSRATLREALRVMELQSLVKSRLGAGTFIADGTAEVLVHHLKHLALQDIFELRMLLDPTIAALAAQRASPEDIASLTAILQEQERQVQQGTSGAEMDTAFHSALAEATHNRALLRLGSALVEVLAPSRDANLQTPERAQNSLYFHKRILQAIENHSPQEARRAMEEHIRSVDAALFGVPQEIFSFSFDHSSVPEFIGGQS